MGPKDGQKLFSSEDSTHFCPISVASSDILVPHLFLEPINDALVCAPLDTAKSLEVLGLVGEGAGEHQADSFWLSIAIVRSSSIADVPLLISLEEVEPTFGLLELLEELLWIRAQLLGNLDDGVLLGPGRAGLVHGGLPVEEHWLLLRLLDCLLHDVHWIDRQRLVVSVMRVL